MAEQLPEQPKGPGEDEPESETEETEESEESEQPEPEPQPPPVPQAKSERDIERAMKALDKEAERHANRVEEIMGGDFAELVPCPLDFTPGFAFLHPTEPLDEGRRALVAQLLGEAQPAPYRQAIDTERCEDCDGLGDVLTGAQVERGRLKGCTRCGGQGWVPKMAPVAQLPQYQQQPRPPAIPNYVPPPGFHLVPDNAEPAYSG